MQRSRFPGARRAAAAVATALAVAAASAAAQTAPAPSPGAAQTAPAPSPGAARATPGGDARTVDELAAFLKRPRRSTEPQRRAVLDAIGAEVPDARGRFQTPKRDPRERDPEGEPDWLASLASLPDGTPGLADVRADVEAIRSLAATRSFRAADVLLRFAFSDVGLIYRDECGRTLRRMAPYSLPALIVASKGRRGDKARYARYQLERLDREDPKKALRYAPNDAVKIAILDAYRKVRHREAVPAVLAAVDDVSPAVREAARRAWMAYVTGPPPPEPPKKRLQLPGGKLTEEEQPLFLNARDFAAHELRRTYERQLGERPPRGMSLADMSRALFDWYDARRARAVDAAFERGIARAAAGEWAAAVAAFDEVLVAAPDDPRRPKMAEAYLQRAGELSRDGQWDAAAILYGKAYAMAPTGPLADRARAGQLVAHGRAVEAAGGDATPLYRRALEFVPDHEGARAALAGDAPAPAAPPARDAARPAPRWALYAGAAGIAVALALAAVGLAERRRRAGRAHQPARAR
ncbi:MAG: hypothetical protein D6689_02075 [Deltaproteobacteria bacterium]|nr:MAG: hypothetical protein D6689_02075 [Deltaproteobacteria bacterium]